MNPPNHNNILSEDIMITRKLMMEAREYIDRALKDPDDFNVFYKRERIRQDVLLAHNKLISVSNIIIRMHEGDRQT